MVVENFARDSFENIFRRDGIPAGQLALERAVQAVAEYEQHIVHDGAIVDPLPDALERLDPGPARRDLPWPWCGYW